jgi:hypothetical protein
MPGSFTERSNCFELSERTSTLIFFVGRVISLLPKPVIDFIIVRVGLTVLKNGYLLLEPP